MIIDCITILATVIALILAAQNNWWTWPVNMLSAAVLMYIFFKDAMYLSFINNAVTFSISLVSCFTWNRNAADNENAISYQSSYNRFITIFCTCTIAILLYSLFQHISSVPICDAICVTLFCMGTFLLKKHRIDAWVYFLIGDILYIVAGIILCRYVYSILYILMIGVDWYGLKKYKRYYEYKNR